MVQTPASDPQTGIFTNGLAKSNDRSRHGLRAKYVDVTPSGNEGGYSPRERRS